MNAEEKWRGSSYSVREDMLMSVGVLRSAARFMVTRTWWSLPTIIQEKLKTYEEGKIEDAG